MLTRYTALGPVCVILPETENLHVRVLNVSHHAGQVMSDVVFVVFFSSTCHLFIFGSKFKFLFGVI